MKKTPKKTQKPLFLSGLVLFILGALGASWQYILGNNVDHISEIISDKAWFYSEFDMSVENLEEVQKLGIDVHNFDFSKISKIFPKITSQELEPWLGRRVGLVKLDSENFVLLAQYRSKKNAKLFLQKFLAPEEAFRVKELEIGDLYLPEYSSQMAFMFYKGWLLFSNSESTLLTMIDSKKILKNNQQYKDVAKGLSEGNFANLFINVKNFPDSKNLSLALKPYRPLMASLHEMLEAGGMTIDLKNRDIKIDTKFLVNEKIYKENLVKKPQNQTIPNLALNIPKDVLFFVNGNNIYEKYKQTKAFLSSIDTQLELVFDGILRAQSKRLFGNSFDLEKDLLFYLKDEYGFVLDFNEGLNFAFISELKSTTDLSSEALKQDILKAQVHMRPALEEVELSDGKKRKELVIKKVEDLKIEEKLQGNNSYFVVGENTENAFAYSFPKDYFIFSTTPSFLAKILQTKQSQISSLAANNDFRQAVLFDFKSSESYGFLNFSKLVQLKNYLDSYSNTLEENSKTLSNLKPYIRNIIFSRLVYPGEVFIKFIIKRN